MTVTLLTDNAELRAFGPEGSLPVTVTADPTYGVQRLSLRLREGIRRVRIEGSQMCLLQVCWTCVTPGDDPEPNNEPEPLDGPQRVNEQQPSGEQQPTGEQLVNGPQPAKDADEDNGDGENRAHRPQNLPALEPLSLSAPFSQLPALLPAALFERGDSNADGAVDISDALHILGFLMNGDKPPPCEKAADANDDGTIDLSDSVSLLGAQFLGRKALPPPYGICGVDPSEEGLACRTSTSCRDGAAEATAERRALVEALVDEAYVAEELEDYLLAHPGELPLLQAEHLVFTFGLARAIDTAEVARWRGSLLLQDPAELEELTAVRYVTRTDDGGDEEPDYWYRNPDDSLSKRLVGAGNELVGVLTMTTESKLTTTFDLDGDRQVDVLGSVGLNLEQLLIFREGRGIRWLDTLLHGRDPFCPGFGGLLTGEPADPGTILLGCTPGESGDPAAGDEAWAPSMASWAIAPQKVPGNSRTPSAKDASPPGVALWAARA